MDALNRWWQRLLIPFRWLRAHSSLFNRIVEAIEHYATVNGGGQAAASAYYAFLAFFPILAMGFFVVGYIARFYPQAQAGLIDAVNTFFPNMVGDGSNQIPIDTFSRFGNSVGLIGLAGLLFTGLGWLSSIRNGLYVVFDRPRDDRPNFFVGKFRDLYNLALLGATLLVSVSMSSAITGYGADLVRLVGLEPDDYWPGLLLNWLAILLSLGITTGLFVMMYRFLAHPSVSRRALWQGGFVAGLLFEVLKWAAVTVISHTASLPAAQAFGIALVVVVWINYFSRIAMFGAAWARVASPRTMSEGELAAAEEEWD